MDVFREQSLTPNDLEEFKARRNLELTNTLYWTMQIQKKSSLALLVIADYSLNQEIWLVLFPS